MPGQVKQNFWRYSKGRHTKIMTSANINLGLLTGMTIWHWLQAGLILHGIAGGRDPVRILLILIFILLIICLYTNDGVQVKFRISTIIKFLCGTDPALTITLKFHSSALVYPIRIGLHRRNKYRVAHRKYSPFQALLVSRFYNNNILLTLI